MANDLNFGVPTVGKKKTLVTSKVNNKGHHT